MAKISIKGPPPPPPASPQDQAAYDELRTYLQEEADETGQEEWIEATLKFIDSIYNQSVDSLTPKQRNWLRKATESMNADRYGEDPWDEQWFIDFGGN